MYTGVEMVARDDSLEENIGVVTFGHITQVRHYLTKDYEVVRHCVGMELLYLCIFMSIYISCLN